MNAKDQTLDANDFPVAKALNESVDRIFFIIRCYQVVGPMKEFDPDEINRAYIFLVNELESLYDRNPKLAEINPEPVWRKFDILRDKMYALQKYLEEHDTTRAHILRVEKLCILSEHEIPQFSTKQQKYLDDSKTVTCKYLDLIVKDIDKSKENESETDLHNDPRNLRFWCIEKYKVVYKPDGTILVNDALILKKIHAGSTAERLLEQSVNSPNKLFKPKLGQTARNLSTVISSAGFKSTLREIFFPIVSDENGVIFRPTVSRDELIKDRIDTYEIDWILSKAGAEIAVRPKEELIALGIAAPDDDD